MRRNLYESIKIKQSASGTAVDRDGCLSAVFAADVSAISGSPTSSSISIAVTHCDTESGTYSAVDDERLFVGCKAEQAVTAGKQAVWNIDLLACKRYIKVTATPKFTGGTTPTATAAYALVLGDNCEQ